MAPEEPVTLGELSRSLAGLERRIETRFDHVNQRLDSLQYVSKGEHELQIGQLRERLDELEESRRWTVRTLVAAFVYPLLLALVIAVMSR